MSQTFHLLTGEYPPHSGGVGDYTQLVAEGLAARGCDVHVWCPTIDARATMPAGVGRPNLHRLPDHFGAASRRTLAAAFEADHGRVLLQYVPNALGMRGANVPFCSWLRRAGRKCDVRVMFHEPYFYFTCRRPLRNGLAIVQRLMASILLRTSPVSYLSTASWQRLLAPLGVSGARLIVLPIPSTVATSAADADVARWRALFSEHGRHSTIVGHFGTYGDHVASEMRAVIPAIARTSPEARLVCLGRNSDAFAGSLSSGSGQVLGTGALSRGDLAAALRACDVLVQPYPDGVTTRRTSVMAGLANRVATVTTSGALTESVWHEDRGVAVAQAGNPAAIAAAVSRLLSDPAERSALADRGARMYEDRFSIGRTIDALLADMPELVRA